MPARPAPDPGHAAPLRVEYRVQSPDAALGAPNTLAVFGFGDAAPDAHADPRYLHVALPAHGQAPVECWTTPEPARHGREGGIAWSEAGALQFGALQVADDGDLEGAAARAYARLQDWLRGSSHAHLLRTWNYMDAITGGEGDAERYRRFCVGRARGIQRLLAPDELPAATAIGHPRPVGRFQLYWLAARTPGIALENPRQLAAWRYPRQYGPQSPGFARGMLPSDPAMPLLVSGTAAVVGHASRHPASLDAQLDETLTNLGSLIATARARRPGLAAVMGAGTRLKVYVRDRGALGEVASLLESRLPAQVPRLVLHGHVCRRELAVEIDGAHA